MKELLTSGLVLSMIFLTACDRSMAQATETERELCRQWGNSLPTRSRQDTPQTQAEIQTSYGVFAASCPAWVHLIP